MNTGYKPVDNSKDEPMASRVNTRFVIILIVAVIGILGLLMLAYSVAYKSASDLAHRGDQFMAQGDYKQAELAYSKSVNKDSTNTENLRKWIGALEKIVPETETEYRDRFYSSYLGAINKTAMILRNDVDAHEKYLRIRHDMLNSGYSRSLADGIIQDTSNALAFFNSDPEQVQDWERLKRYRGLAIVSITRRNEVLNDDQYPLATDDLERAIQADPDDIESAIGMMFLKMSITEREAKADDAQARITTLQENLQLANDFLSTHPDNVEMMMQRLRLKMAIAAKENAQTLDGMEQLEALTALMAGYQSSLDVITDLLLGAQRDQLTLSNLELYMGLESTILPENNFANTRRMIDPMIEADGENAELLLIAARVAKQANEPDEALGWYARIAEIKTKPMSYVGLRQYGIAIEALHAQTVIKTEQAIALGEDAPQSEIDAAIQEAVEFRDRYAATVTDDLPALILLDGKILQAKGEYAEALRLFKKYNEQTQRIRPEGLWQEGVTAMQIGQQGVARSAFIEMIAIDTDRNRVLGARLSLAQIAIGLNNYREAAKHYQDILATAPTWQIAIDGLARMNMLLNPELNEDPVLADIYTSRQMRLGDERTPGDTAKALELLYQSAEKFEYDPRIAMELVSVLFENNNVKDAREIITKSLAFHPDDEKLNSTLNTLKSDDIIDIRIAITLASSRDELDKLLVIAKIASENNRKDLFDETIAELNSIAPDDKRTIEITFIHALQYDDLAAAQAIADRPENNQISKLGFEARIAITENNPEKAIELLTKATAIGSADADIYRMLAMLERSAGNYDGAIQSFESALAIRPDNAQTITEYIRTLVNASQFEEALSATRRLQRHGSSDPVFMNLWLNLESYYGGLQGRDFAIRQRERIRDLDDANIENKFQLARMYIEAKRWDDAMELIDQLRTYGDPLALTELEATWYADQGAIGNRNGLVLANEIFAKYIDGLTPPVGARPYIVNAEFMLKRGRPDLAIAAANEAVKRQTPETMLGSKLLGTLYMRINNLSKAVAAYKEVVANNADEDFQIHKQLIDSFVTLERYDEAQEVYSELPESIKTQIMTMLLASDIARGLGDNARADTLLNDAVARYPNNAYVYIKRAQSMIGDEALFNDLLSDISRAINIDSNNAQSYLVRAAGNFSLNRKDDGLKDLQTAIRLNPTLDKSIYSVLNELLARPGGAGKAIEVAREVISRRPNDANLMSQIGGLFMSRQEWSKAAEIFGMAWEKRHGVGDGAMYIDALVRMTPPDAFTANEVINGLAKMVGDINKTPDLLAAQALVLKARGRDDLALNQINKAFDLSVSTDTDLIRWSGNLSRYFEGDPVIAQVQYLEQLKGRNTNPVIQTWLDYFIARHMVMDSEIDPRAFETLTRLEDYTTNPQIQVLAFRVHGNTLFNQDKFEEAAVVWKRGLDVFSDDWELNNNLAYVLSSKLDRTDEAFAFAQVAIDQNMDRSEVYETMASIYILLQKYDEAEQMIEMGSKFIQSIPARITMVLSMGHLELARGNIIEARSLLNDANSMLRSAPTAYPNLEKDIDAFELEIDSADG